MKAHELAAQLLQLPPETEIYVYNGEFFILSPAHFMISTFEVSTDPVMKPRREGDLSGHMDYNNRDPEFLGEGYEYRDIHWIGVKPYEPS